MTHATSQPLLATAQPQRHRQPTVRARALAHLIFARPDLATAERFLLDCGLLPARRDADCLYLRGTGTHTRSDDYKDGSGNPVHASYERWSGRVALGGVAPKP